MGQPSPFFRMGRSWLVNLNHISSVGILHATLSFESDSVKSVTMSRNSLKTLLSPPFSTRCLEQNTK